MIESPKKLPEASLYYNPNNGGIWFRVGDGAWEVVSLFWKEKPNKHDRIPEETLSPNPTRQAPI